MLRWERDEDGGWRGHSGRWRVADVWALNGRWCWQVGSRGSARPESEETPEAARAAAEAAWGEWCANAGLAPVPTWRPIAGVRSRSEEDTYLVWCPGLSVSGPWVVAYRSGGEWCAAVNGVTLYPQPTYWMALPEPPEAPGGEGWCRPTKSADAAGEMS